MDTYRCTRLTVHPDRSPHTVKSKYAQRSQRYQKIQLVSQDSSVRFSRVGFEQIRPRASPKTTFNCSSELLNQIWCDGVKTVDMCTVAQGETAPAWELTESGTRIFGQHWAPCRHGTRWSDKKIRFDVLIEAGGASWGVHMVANGLIFCLDIAEKVLYACEGLSHKSTIFPVAEKGRWALDHIDLRGWTNIETITAGDSVVVSIQGQHVATVTGLDLRPLLGGSTNNTGSIAFGGPCEWVAQYRHLSVHNRDNSLLYKNDLLAQDRARTLSDFQVGTNALACTIDGAKRDRACFGGDLYVMGRSISYSTMDFAAVKGSIKLLTSHQTKEGYLGNLCPIQAPVHDNAQEPPSYAFYSLTYALLLVVAIKDYYIHSGDEVTRSETITPLKRLFEFVEGFMNVDGVISAPPPLSMHWFPMGGPVFGPSGPLNVAYYEALRAMISLTSDQNLQKVFLSKAETLKNNIREHFVDPASGTIRLSNALPKGGICQSTSAHALKLGLSSTKSIDHLCCKPTQPLPVAFRDLAHWSRTHVVSPYATGFAVEALFECGEGRGAIDLLERVWGTMADKSSPNYSGGHWEALRPDGSPHSHDTSLIHGWSTWPVFLLPRYLAGLHPIEAGWKLFGVSPILVGLNHVDCTMETVAGTIKVEVNITDETGCGVIRLLAPAGTQAKLTAPAGWKLSSSPLLAGTGEWVECSLSKDDAKPAASIRIMPREGSQSPSHEEENTCSLPSPRGERGCGQYLRSLWRSAFGRK